ncbi:MAG: hypothetical protein DRH24_17915, partial [Deltaproteobacteria bacterium]
YRGLVASSRLLVTSLSGRRASGLNSRKTDSDRVKNACHNSPGASLGSNFLVTFKSVGMLFFGLAV